MLVAPCDYEQPVVAPQLAHQHVLLALLDGHAQPAQLLLSRDLKLSLLALLELVAEQVRKRAHSHYVDEEVLDGLAELGSVVAALDGGGESGEDDDETDEGTRAQAPEGVELEEPERLLRLRLELLDGLVAPESLHLLGGHLLVLRRAPEHLHVRVLQHHRELEVVVVDRGLEINLGLVVLLQFDVGARAVVQRRSGLVLARRSEILERGAEVPHRGVVPALLEARQAVVDGVRGGLVGTERGVGVGRGLALRGVDPHRDPPVPRGCARSAALREDSEGSRAARDGRGRRSIDERDGSDSSGADGHRGGPHRDRGHRWSHERRHRLS